jgi:hypothetical protein
MWRSAAAEVAGITSTLCNNRNDTRIPPKPGRLQALENTSEVTENETCNLRFIEETSLAGSFTTVAKRV